MRTILLSPHFSFAIASFNVRGAGQGTSIGPTCLSVASIRLAHQLKIVFAMLISHFAF